LFNFLQDIFDLLAMALVGDEQGVFTFGDDEVFDSNENSSFIWRSMPQLRQARKSVLRLIR
jgi:hypothetical protein